MTGMKNPLATMPAERRRALTLGIMGAAVVVVLAAILTIAFAPEQGRLALILALVFLVAALVAELVFLLVGEAIPFDEQGTWHKYAEEATSPPGEELLLRCTACSEVFTVIDTGARPLRHACPRCGKVGVLRAPPSAAPPTG